MNFQLKISIFYIVFVFIGAFAQAQEKEVVNYWTLRKRLVGECTEDFFGDCNNPFVHTGANLPGYGIPLGEMNYKLNYGDVNGDCGFDQSGTGALKWGDGTSYMGYYWAVLATEKKLLEKYGYETHKTEVELFWALKAFERLDETAESYWGCSNSYNGAFMRDDVPTSIINSNYIGYNCIASDYINNANLGTQGNNIMSKDQIVNIFMGLMFIKKMFWATDGVIVNGEYMNFHMKAVEIADKIANYIHLNYTSPTVSWNNYQIKNPCNGILASLGYDASVYILESGSKLTLEDGVYVYDATFKLNGGQLIYNPLRINGRFKVVDAGGNLIYRHTSSRFQVQSESINPAYFDNVLLPDNGSNTQVLKTETYYAPKIEVAGNNQDVEIQGSAHVVMVGGEKIHLKPGFKTSGKTYFHAYFGKKSGVYCSKTGNRGANNSNESSQNIEKNDNEWQLTLFPNPTKDKFSLKTMNTISKDLQVDVYSSLGKKVHTELIKSTFWRNGAYEINLYGMAKGLYIVKVSAADQVKSFKLFKI